MSTEHNRKVECMTTLILKLTGPLKMPQIDGVAMFYALKNRDKKATICLITADISYLEQLKGKIPNIEKYVIYKPILLRNLKDKLNQLLMEKNNDNTCLLQK